MVIRFSLLIVLMSLSLTVFAKGFTAQVDRLSVGISDHVQLVLTLSDAQGSQPDMSALDDDFTILQRSQSSNLKVINGVVSQETRWVFLLSPNRKGTLTIPSFISGNYKSASINIEVGDAPVSQSTTDEVMLEVELKPLNPYAKAQAIYTQRLYFSKQLVDNASLDRPKLVKGEAGIIFLGSTNPSYVQRNGQTYQLIERFYSVFPKSAGEISFAPSVFRGSIEDGSQHPHFNRFMFNNGKRVTAYSSKATLNVAAQPNTFTGNHWLPSSNISLDMSWSKLPETLNAGEPVTVTVMLMAEGLKAETLPELRLDWPDSIKTYPEKPEFRTDKRANGVVGLRQEKVVLVANQNGEFQIPALEVPWWNTVTNQQEVARLEAFTVNVSGAAVQPLPEVNTAKAEPEKAMLDQADEIEVADEQSIPQVSVIDKIKAVYSDNQQLILSLLGIALMLLSAAIWYRVRPKKIKDHRQQLLTTLENDLASACKAQDTKAALAILPKWAEQAGIYPATLAGIERCEDKVLAKEVALLSQASYSAIPQVWDGKGLIMAVKQFNSASSAEPVNDSLNALHPLH